ncbi:F-box domain, partial [Arabidopsis thaliana x Arabidopsis arenosa]
MSDSEEKTSNEDSKQPVLIVDLLRSILERLSFVDFHRARCISSEWYSTSESCLGVKNPTTPWIILFPSEHVENKNDSCKLYNPRDHSSYIVRDLGFDLARSRCLANSGSWFLMLDRRTDFHLLNPFTRVRIPLPSLESTGDGNVFIRVYENVSDGSGSHYKVAVTLSGEVLIILARVEPYPRMRCFFDVYKMDPKSSEWKMIKSIGGEALLLDLGITVEAKVMKNCIYFSSDQFRRYNGNSLCNDYNNNDIHVYHIRTEQVVQVFEDLTASSTTLFKDSLVFPHFWWKMVAL